MDLFLLLDSRNLGLIYMLKTKPKKFNKQIMLFFELDILERERNEVDR